MNNTERAARLSLKKSHSEFLAKEGIPEFSGGIDAKLQVAGGTGNCNFLDTHLDYLPENLEDYSEEQGEQFYRDIKEIERRYQEMGDINMMTDLQMRRSIEDKRARHKRKKE